jgi:predicted Zn-dependent peptidase
LDGHLRIGSRFETEADNGISHFLEHMLYRGTPRHPTAHELALAFENLGGTLVATTAADTGSLSIASPLQNWKAVLDLYAEVYRSPLMNGIEVERGIVSEEILEGMDEDGNCIDADDLIRDLTFPDHPLGLPITGSVAHLERFDTDGLRAHHDAFYVANNTVIGVAGPLPADVMLDTVSQALGALPRGARPTAAAPVEQAGPRFRYVKHADSQTMLRLGFRGPGMHDPDEAAVDLLLRILDDGLSTRLYAEICDERGLCYDVSGSYETYEDCGLIEFSADSAHDRTEAVFEQFLSITKSLREAGPSEAELEKAKRRHEWQLFDWLDNPEDLTTHFALSELGGTEPSLQDRLARIQNLTARDLKRVAERFFTRAGLNVVCVGVLPKRTRERLERHIASY